MMFYSKLVILYVMLNLFQDRISERQCDAEINSA